jgi:hypothetical protein
MTWTSIIDISLTVLVAFAWYRFGGKNGRKQERTRIIEHGYWFQRNQSKISPTMNDFLSAVESGRHWE